MRRDPRKTFMVGVIGFLVFIAFGWWHVALVFLAFCMTVALVERHG